MYNYAVIDGGYCEASSFVGGFDWEMLELKTYCKLKRVLMVTSTFELCCRRLDLMHACILRYSIDLF